MNPWNLIDSTDIPAQGGELRLYRRADEYSIVLAGGGGELMSSRKHGSEDALAGKLTIEEKGRDKTKNDLEAHGRDNKDTGIEQSPLEALIRQQLRVVVQPCKYLRLTCCNIPVEEGKNKGKDEGKDPNQKEVKNSRKQHVVLSVPT